MYIDDQVRLLVDMSFPADFVSGLENVSLDNKSVYDVLKRRYGLVSSSSERWIEAILPTDNQAARHSIVCGNDCSTNPTGKTMSMWKT